jgi:peptide/nickel transport system permease protein
MTATARPATASSKSSQRLSEAGQFRRAMKRFRQNVGGAIGAVVLAVILLTAILAPLITPYDPLEQNPVASLQSPSAQHYFGTDNLGRDVLSRVIIGSRQSLLVGFIAIAIACTIGTALGLITGFYEGWLDLIIQRVIDIQLAFPGLLLAMAIVAVLGPGLQNVMIAVGISLIPSFARMVRASVLSAKNEMYVDAAKALGSSNGRVMVRHILPNVLMPILVLATIGIAWAILIGASLSFLGLGAQPPDPEWGRDLSDGRTYLSVAWWTATFPGLAIMLTILSINLLGDGLREVLDPRLRTR